MKRYLRLAIPLLVIMAVGYFAGVIAPTAKASYGAGNFDPCKNPANYLYAPISAATATTTGLLGVPSPAGQSYNICGVYLNSVGGTSTLEYGLTAACTTPTVKFTGAYAAASTVTQNPNGSTQFSVPASQAVCLLSGASTTGTNGVLVYTQQ